MSGIRKTASNSFQQILRADPANSEAEHIGFAYPQKSDLARAIPQPRGVIAADPGLASAHYDPGVALKQKDELEEVKIELIRTLELEPSMVEAHYTLGMIDWQSGDFEEDRRSDTDGHDPETGLRRGVLHARHGPEAEGRSPWGRDGQLLRQKGDLAASKAAFAEGAAIKQKAEADQTEMLNRKR